MVRLTHLLVLFLVCSSFLLSCVVADADPLNDSADNTQPRRVPKVDPASYPYGKPKESIGVKFSEYQSLAVPTSVLLLILLVSVAAIGFFIYKIFDTQQQKELKEQAKIAAREEKRAAKAASGSKKGSKKE